MPTWLLVGNASRARLFETQAHPKHLTLLKEFLHPPSREKGEELASDRPGHFQGEAQGMEGTTHGAFNEPISPKSYEHERFAMELAKELNDGRNHNRFSNLMIVASPHFHGLLNQHMNNHVAKMVSTHLNKDYTDLDENSLIEKLRA
jgi:protein required for attachment to host cells